MDKVVEKINKAQHLSDSVLAKPLGSKLSPLRQDVSVLKKLLEYEVKINKSSDFRLDERAVSILFSDYCLLRDFHMGEHYKRLGSILRIHGPNLLNKKQLAEFQSQKLSGNNAVRWLDEKTGHLMRALWHFSVVLCRELQSGENNFTTSDAYWLGCIDEVYGTNLYGERALAESDPEKTAEPPKLSD